MHDITNQRFGRLIAIKHFDAKTYAKAVHIRWLCRCDCGNTAIVYVHNLTRGATKSCGCLNNEVRIRSCTTHGLYENKSRTYSIWSGMRQRCNNPNNNRYHRYGGRGIRICKRWENYANFFADMGPAPKGKTLDRFPNNNGNYEPSNCRWATPKEQGLNRKDTRKVRYRGKIIPVMTLAIKFGFTNNAIRQRALRRGNNFIEAFRSIGINVDAA